MDVDMAISSIIGPTDSHPQPGPRYTGPTQGKILILHSVTRKEGAKCKSPSSRSKCPTKNRNSLSLLKKLNEFYFILLTTIM